VDTIKIINESNPEDRKAVVAGLVKYNAQHVEPESWEEIELYLKDEKSILYGGLIGNTHWGWLFIKHLWVIESIRHQGYGRKLMNNAEQIAIKRGCQYSHTDTYDYQALPFYQKLGYTIFGKLENFPEGHNRYFLKKSLV
jgi:GNAT superfamily N-acetyltransferase